MSRLKRCPASIRVFVLMVMVAGAGLVCPCVFAQRMLPGGLGEGGPARGKNPAGEQKDVLNPTDPSKYHKDFNRADILVVAELTEFKLSPVVARSMPPIYSATLTLKPSEVLRGSLKVGKAIQANLQRRQRQALQIPLGRYVVCLSKGRGGLKVERVFKAAGKTVEVARKAASAPIGWAPGEKTPPCLAGKGIALKVVKVAPEKEIKWTNPDGDGLYKITVTNTTDEVKLVLALFNDGEKILWRESIRVLCQDKCQYLPGARKLSEDLKHTTLQPGQSVSTVVNALALKGLKWPQGGYRIEFRFALGELAVNKSLYYMSRHHDALREKAVGEKAYGKR